MTDLIGEAHPRNTDDGRAHIECLRGADGVPNLLPSVNMPARLGWHAEYTEVVYSDPPYLVLQAIPVFPRCSPLLAERGIVWDIFSLIDSAKQPGAHALLNSDCGYAPDSGLNESILVSHPDDRTIIWELDINGLRPALDDAMTDGIGFVRLRFSREEYEADIRAMVRDLKERGEATVAVDAVKEICDLDYMRQAYPDAKSIQVGLFEPEMKGMELEKLLEIDPDAEFEREPIFPRGADVELGYFDKGDGHEFVIVNGQVDRCWWGRYITRWQALAAFHSWLSFTCPGCVLPEGISRPAPEERNRRFLLRESDRAPCHEAGRHLARVMQNCVDEGDSAPGVTVRYRECPLWVATAR